jgi:hypothetical protein
MVKYFFSVLSISVCTVRLRDERAGHGASAHNKGFDMKKFLLYGLGTLVALVGLLLIVASFQPKSWKLERSVLIDAPRDKVWTIVSDLNRYTEWNTFAKKDPDAKITVTGPAATLGSSYAWDGAQSGAGRMTTVHMEAGERIDFNLEFTRPMTVTNKTSFLLGNQEGPTKMTWSMEGTHEGFPGLMARAIHLFVDIDTMVGKDFESGLAVLKGIAEKEARAGISGITSGE